MDKHAGHGRIEDIEALRAFAVGLVLLQHIPWNLLPFMRVDQGAIYSRFAFWSGVDLFFAISGFVIARSLLPSLPPAREARAFIAATLGFWVRRAFRLLPTAWLWLAVMLLLAAGFNSSGVFGPFRANLDGAIAAIVYLANFQLLHALPSGRTGVTAIYWTLSIEEQFYIALPFIVYLFRARLPLAVAVIALAQLFVDRTSAHGSLLMNMTRSDGLALGVLLAIWSGGASYRRIEPQWLARGPWRWLTAPAFLFVFSLASGPPMHARSFDMTLVTALSILAAWVASYDRGYVLPAGKLKAALCWMGARSYALYLIHLPVYHAAVEFWSRVNPGVLKPSWPHLAILLATGLPPTFLLADLNFRYVETPLRRRGARLAESLRRRSARPHEDIAPAAA